MNGNDKLATTAPIKRTTIQQGGSPSSYAQSQTRMPLSSFFHTITERRRGRCRVNPARLGRGRVTFPLQIPSRAVDVARNERAEMRGNEAVTPCPHSVPTLGMSLSLFTEGDT